MVAGLWAAGWAPCWALDPLPTCCSSAVKWKTGVSPVIKGRMPRAVKVQSKDLTLLRTQGGLSGGFVEKPILKMKQVCPISKLVLNTKALMELEEGSRQIKQKPKQRLTPSLLQDPVWASCLQEAPVGTPGWVDPTSSGCSQRPHPQSGLAPTSVLTRFSRPQFCVRSQRQRVSMASTLYEGMTGVHILCA